MLSDSLKQQRTIRLRVLVQRQCSRTSNPIPFGTAERNPGFAVVLHPLMGQCIDRIEIRVHRNVDDQGNPLSASACAISRA